MSKLFAENKFFAVILVASALLNVGLAYKIHRQQNEMLHLGNAGSHANILGATITHLNAKTLDGKPATITFTKNALPTILYVFRPTCGWCERNLPNLRAMEVSAPKRHFRLIGVSLDSKSLKQYVKSKHFSFPVYSDVAPSERVRLDMGGTPQTIMISNEAVVRDWEGAYTPNLQKEIEATLGITLPGISTKLSSRHL